MDSLESQSQSQAHCFVKEINFYEVQGTADQNVSVMIPQWPLTAANFTACSKKNYDNLHLWVYGFAFSLTRNQSVEETFCI